LASTQNVLQKD